MKTPPPPIAAKDAVVAAVLKAIVGAARNLRRVRPCISSAFGGAVLLAACTSAGPEHNRSDQAAPAELETRLKHDEREMPGEFTIGFDLLSNGGPKGDGAALDRQLAAAVAHVPYAGRRLFVHVLPANGQALNAELSRCGIKASARDGADPASDAMLALVRAKGCATASSAIATLRKRAEQEAAPPPANPAPCRSDLTLECMRRFLTDNSAEAERLGVLEARPMAGDLLLVGHGFDSDLNLRIVCAVERTRFIDEAQRAKVIEDCVESFNAKYNG